MKPGRWKGKEKFRTLIRLDKFIFLDGFYVNGIIRRQCSSIFEFCLYNSLQIVLAAQYNISRKSRIFLIQTLSFIDDQNY